MACALNSYKTFFGSLFPKKNSITIVDKACITRNLGIKYTGRAWVLYHSIWSEGFDFMAFGILGGPRTSSHCYQRMAMHMGPWAPFKEPLIVSLYLYCSEIFGIQLRQMCLCIFPHRPLESETLASYPRDFPPVISLRHPLLVFCFLNSTGCLWDGQSEVSIFKTFSVTHFSLLWEILSWKFFAVSWPF